jgi:hypothetical protein
MNGAMAPPADDLRQALEAEAHLSPKYRFVLRYGQDYVPRARPADIPVGVKHYCFRNAFRLAEARDDLTYVEGFGLGVGVESFFTRHAWCVDSDGRVVDPSPTWADPDRELPATLRGVALPMDLVREHVEGDEPTRGALYALDDQLDELGPLLFPYDERVP